MQVEARGVELRSASFALQGHGRRDRHRPCGRRDRAGPTHGGPGPSAPTHAAQRRIVVAMPCRRHRGREWACVFRAGRCGQTGDGEHADGRSGERSDGERDRSVNRMAEQSARHPLARHGRVDRAGRGSGEKARACSRTDPDSAQLGSARLGSARLGSIGLALPGQARSGRIRTQAFLRVVRDLPPAERAWASRYSDAVEGIVSLQPRSRHAFSA